MLILDCLNSKQPKIIEVSRYLAPIVIILSLNAQFKYSLIFGALLNNTYVHRRLDSNNLFNYKATGNRVLPPKRFCSCASSPSGGSIAICDYISAKSSYMDDSNGLIRLLPPIAKHGIHSTGGNGILILPPIDIHTTYDFNPDVTTGIIPDWPLASGRTKKEVEDYCHQKIGNFTSGRICSVISDFSIHQYVQQCIMDIRVNRKIFLISFCSDKLLLTFLLFKCQTCIVEHALPVFLVFQLGG